MKRLSDRHHTLDGPAPGISAALVFRSKATVLQVRRAMRDAIGRDVQRFSVANTLAGRTILAESRTPLWIEIEDAERILLAGKTHNLRLAIRNLNGLEIPADRVFSFWKQVRRTSRLGGYVAGRELREGCLIPSIGGGLCQLSNALYDAALRAGFEIVERHAHTRVIPGSLAERGRDATVFWNYVDLRFKAAHAFRIEAALTADLLVVRFLGDPVGKHPQIVLPVRAQNKHDQTGHMGGCFTCGTHSCFRRVKTASHRIGFGRAAYLLDEYWPEFQSYINATKREADLLCLPIAGRSLNKPNYAWSTSGFGTVKQNRLLTLRRSHQSRRLVSQGANRQRARLAANEKLARRYASLLAYDVTHVTLMQHLLPFLWRGGHLGGRTFDVLMTALPLASLQERLDTAFRLHPDSPTLADFRADSSVVELEAEALRQARKIITPHTEIATLYPDKAVLLEWTAPVIGPETRRIDGRGGKLIFPAATLGRKGAYELRAAINGMDLELVTLGPMLEGKDFWNGVRTIQPRAGEDWLQSAAALVLPAFVEHQPRRLLEAAARGVPVIASTSCGLENVPGVRSIPVGDVVTLRAEIENAIAVGK
jgi:hypothetical protein